MNHDTLLKYYQELLAVYTENVQRMEAEHEKERQTYPAIGGIPHLMLNGRMFIYDEYLTNPYHRGFCYEEKAQIMPHLIPFIVAYEKSTNEEKQEFEKLKPKGTYQEYLDQLWQGKLPLLNFLDEQLYELGRQEARLEIPFSPKKSNATKQMADYKKAKQDYDEKRDSIDCCRREVQDRIGLAKRLFEDNSLS